MKKLKHGQVKKFAQVRIADEGQSQGSISGRSDSESEKRSETEKSIVEPVNKWYHESGRHSLRRACS